MLQRARGGEDVLAALDELVATATDLSHAVAGCHAWAGPRRAGALQRLDRLSGALATVRSALVVAEQDAAQTAPGDRDYVATRARVTRAGVGEARREVRQAQTLHDLPAVADAVRDGGMPVAHLDALARVSAGAGEQAQSALGRADVQDTLVRWAGRQTLKEFTASAARLVASFDPASLEHHAQAQYRERYLHLTHLADGTYLKGRLDRVAGERLRVAIASVGQAPDPERSKPQADADALVALADRALAQVAGVRARRTGPDGALLPDPEQDAADARVSGVAGRPIISVLVPAEAFAELHAHQSAVDHAPEVPRPWRPVEPAVLEDGTPVAMSELARMLCDSEVGRIVLGADSVPMDLGRTTRLYTGAQRRAVIVRDRACAWNGCDVPAAYCEVHHIRWWERDAGPTSVVNGVLLCSHHHHTVHAHDLDIIRLAAPRERLRRTLAEPTRYRFTTRGGRVLNAPPGGGERGGTPPGDVAPGADAPPGGGDGQLDLWIGSQARAS